jgi:perosamine synthetase
VADGVDRNEFVSQLNKRGVGARIYYPLPIHRQPVFERMGHYRSVALPETEKASRAVLSLPVYPGLSQAERDYVVQEVNKLC